MPTPPTPAGAVRAATPGDTALLERLFAESRAAELAALPDAGIRSLFLSMQLTARNAHYARMHPDAESLIIVDGSPLAGAAGLGRLLIDWLPERAHIIDVAVLAEHHGCGHGSRALSEMLRRADDADLAVTLEVLGDNRAAHRLYSRLGFADVWAEPGEPASVYHGMRRASRSERAATGAVLTAAAAP